MERVSNSVLSHFGFLNSFMEIQFTYHIIHPFKLCNTTDFSMFTAVAQLSPQSILDDFVSPQKKSTPISSYSPVLPSPQPPPTPCPGQQQILLTAHWLILDISCKWNTMCGPLRFWFTNVFKAHPWLAYIGTSFLWPNNIPLFENTTFCPSIRLLVGTWVVSTFWLKFTNNTAINVCTRFCGDSIFIPLGCVPESGIEGHMAAVFKLFEELPTCFPKSSTIVHAHWQGSRVPVSPCPFQHLVISFSLVTAILVSVKWYLVEVFICISLRLTVEPLPLTVSKEATFQKTQLNGCLKMYRLNRSNIVSFIDFGLDLLEDNDV